MRICEHIYYSTAQQFTILLKIEIAIKIVRCFAASSGNLFALCKFRRVSTDNFIKTLVDSSSPCSANYKTTTDRNSNSESEVLWCFTRRRIYVVCIQACQRRQYFKSLYRESLSRKKHEQRDVCWSHQNGMVWIAVRGQLKYLTRKNSLPAPPDYFERLWMISNPPCPRTL